MVKHKILLVPFPLDDFSATKVRPAIGLTEPVGFYEHIVIAFISSKVPDRPFQSDVIVFKRDKYFEATGLAIDSLIRLHKLLTIPKKLVVRELGNADQDLVSLVKDRIRVLFGVQIKFMLNTSPHSDQSDPTTQECLLSDCTNL